MHVLHVEGLGAIFFCLPVVKFRRVSYAGSEGPEQLPEEAVPAGERLPVGEQEADRVVPREADVTVGPVGDILHQPVHADQGRAVDV